MWSARTEWVRRLGGREAYLGTLYGVLTGTPREAHRGLLQMGRTTLAELDPLTRIALLKLLTIWT